MTDRGVGKPSGGSPLGIILTLLFIIAVIGVGAWLYLKSAETPDAPAAPAAATTSPQLQSTPQDEAAPAVAQIG